MCVHVFVLSDPRGDKSANENCEKCGLMQIFANAARIIVLQVVRVTWGRLELG